MAQNSSNSGCKQSMHQGFEKISNQHMVSGKKIHWKASKWPKPPMKPKCPIMEDHKKLALRKLFCLWHKILQTPAVNSQSIKGLRKYPISIWSLGKFFMWGHQSDYMRFHNFFKNDQKSRLRHFFKRLPRRIDIINLHHTAYRWKAEILRFSKMSLLLKIGPF